MIESHSDHIIDWFRILVKEGQMSHTYVKILNFDNDGARSAIHAISMDKDGNLVDVPKNNRAFFMNERDRLIGFVE